MNIETAIKQNKQWLKENPHLGEVRGFKALPPYDAIQLGIEALERCQHNYLHPERADFRRLPSETEGVKE